MERWKEDVIIGLRNRKPIEVCARMLAGKTVAELYEAKEADPAFSKLWDAAAPVEDDPEPPSGRALTPIALEALMWSQCSDEEAAAYFGLEVGAFKGRIAGDEALSKAYKLGPMGGKAALKRAQFEKALSGDTTMQTWVGKQALGQSDKVEQTNTIRHEVDDKSLARRLMYIMAEGGVALDNVIDVDAIDVAECDSVAEGDIASGRDNVGDRDNVAISDKTAEGDNEIERKKEQ